MLFRHARSRVWLRLPSSQSEASVHFLPGQRALLQTSTPQDCSLSRDPAGLPGVCQKARVRQELRVFFVLHLLFLNAFSCMKSSVLYKRLLVSLSQVYNRAYLGLSS